MATLTNSYQFLGRSSVMTSTNGNLPYYLLLYGKTSANNDTGIHTVTIKSVLASTTSGATYYSYTQAHNGKINGSTAFSGTNKPSKAWELSNFTAGGVTYKTGTLLGEGSVNVDCTDGSAKEITLSCYYIFNGNAASYTPAKGTNRTVSVKATLSAIARGAKILTAPNFRDGENPTITYSNPAGNNVTALEACITDTKGNTTYVPYRAIPTTGTSYTFNLTDAERQNLQSAAADSNSIRVRFYIRTKLGGNTYYSYSPEKTFSIDDADPIITASVVDSYDTTVALTGDNKKLVKFFSNAFCTMTVDGQKGAAIDESLYIIRCGDDSIYSSVGEFACVEDNEFVFSAEDSRGNVTKKTVTLPMVDYVKLTCDLANNRPDALGNMTVACTGNYFDGNFGAADNTLTVRCRYAVADAAFTENWIDMNVIMTGENRYYASAEFVIPDFDQSSYYSFEAMASDKLDIVESSQNSVKSTPLFHWGEDDFVFEVPVIFNAGASGTGSTEGDTFDGNKTITGNLRLKGKNSNYGNHLLFGDSNFCYISEPADDEMMIHAKKLHFDVSGGVFVDGYAIPILDKGTWTPALNSSAISSYTTQYGWYSKMGQSVTIGFYIKATCKSGYNSTLISISGMPFTPLHPAAGGGMCSGAYVAANQDFQCFVAETNKTITTRTQTCNNTTATNLTTSASGCWYRSSGGEITLSGTITFIANS